MSQGPEFNGWNDELVQEKPRCHEFHVDIFLIIRKGHSENQLKSTRVTQLWIRATFPRINTDLSFELKSLSHCMRFWVHTVKTPITIQTSHTHTQYSFMSRYTSEAESSLNIKLHSRTLMTNQIASQVPVTALHFIISSSGHTVQSSEFVSCDNFFSAVESKHPLFDFTLN